MWIHDTDERYDVALQRGHQALEVARILESLVDERLKLVAHRGEEGRQEERTDHDRGVGALARHCCECPLHQRHRAGVQPRQDRGQRHIDDRPIDDEVDVVQAVAENRDPDCNRDGCVRQAEIEKRVVQRGEPKRDGDELYHQLGDDHRPRYRDPLQLLASVV